MANELTVLALGALLLLAHILLAGRYRTKQYGIGWNAGPRDEEMPPLNPIAGRLVRAQANFQETLPIAIIGLAGVAIAGKASEWTALAGWVWLIARIIYLPLYWAGIPYLRSAVWGIATLGALVPVGVLLLA